MQLTRIDRDDTRPVSLEAAKRYLRILSNDFDLEVEAALDAAVQTIDLDDDGFGGLDFPLMRQTWAMELSGFPGVIALPFQRVSEIVSISYFPADGETQTLAPELYHLVKNVRREWRVVLANGGAWPSVAIRPDAVRVEFRAGFETPADIPADLKQAILFLLGHYYENRSAVITGTIAQELPMAVNSILAKYRRIAF